MPFLFSGFCRHFLSSAFLQAFSGRFRHFRLRNSFQAPLLGNTRSGPAWLWGRGRLRRVSISSSIAGIGLVGLAWAHRRNTFIFHNFPGTGCGSGVSTFHRGRSPGTGRRPGPGAWQRQRASGRAAVAPPGLGTGPGLASPIRSSSTLHSYISPGL